MVQVLPSRQCCQCVIVVCCSSGRVCHLLQPALLKCAGVQWEGHSPAPAGRAERGHGRERGHARERAHARERGHARRGRRVSRGRGRSVSSRSRVLAFCRALALARVRVRVRSRSRLRTPPPPLLLRSPLLRRGRRPWRRQRRETTLGHAAAVDHLRVEQHRGRLHLLRRRPVLSVLQCSGRVYLYYSPTSSSGQCSVCCSAAESLSILQPHLQQRVVLRLRLWCEDALAHHGGAVTDAVALPGKVLEAAAAGLAGRARPA